MKAQRGPSAHLPGSPTVQLCPLCCSAQWTLAFLDFSNSQISFLNSKGSLGSTWFPSSLGFLDWGLKTLSRQWARAVIGHASINFFFTILKFFHYFKWFQVQHFYLSNTPVSHFLDHLIFNDLELCDHLEFFTLETMNFSLLLSFQLILLFPLYQCFNLIKTSLILLLFSQNVFPFPCLFSLHLIVNCFNLSDQYFHQILSPRYQLWIHPNVTELKGFAVWGVLFNKKKHSYH